MPFFYSPFLPLQVGDPSETMVGAVRWQIQANLKNLILTAPGEKIGNNDFGVGAKHYLFDQDSSNAIGNLKAKVESQVSMYMPFITVRNIKVSKGSRNEVLLRMEYSVKELGFTDVLMIAYSSQAYLETVVKGVASSLFGGPKNTYKD